MKRLLLGLLFLVEPAFAAMSLDKVIVYLDDKPSSRDDIVVVNPDQQNLYLKTEVFRVDNPGRVNESRVRVLNPDEFKLLVSPAKAVLAPGEKRRFRLVALDRDLKQEQVYRVTFKPVVGEVKSDQTALKILIAYQALVFVQPLDGHYQVELIEKEGVHQLINSGNINVELVEVQYCPTEGECQALSQVGRLYAGTSIKLPKRYPGGELKVLLRGQQSERIRLPIDG
ncbi:hypothetical protein ACJJIF_10660 [Microbulbifer sp. SSSA002]|uniref:fimbrial biogenesis chaperone n=1 Tax=unclassified Microbulbifer TaxID=2619833 RepID=UPI0040396E01